MLIILLFVLFLFMIFCAVPISFGMGIASYITLLLEGRIDFITILSKMFAGVNSTSWLAIPFFMLAGNLMEHGGISHRLIKFATACVGHLRGGMAHVSVLVSMIFAGVSGSAVADTTAVGSVLMPAMNEEGYDKGFVAALQACAGTIGPIIPPSINMVLVAAMTGLSVGRLFLGGIIPGIMIGVSLMIVAYLYAKKKNIPLHEKKSRGELLDAFKSSVWALFMPVIIIGGILSGLFTATEAGMIACVYGIFVGVVIYKELTPKLFFKALQDAAVSGASILFMSACANVMAYTLTRLDFAPTITDLLLRTTQSPVIFLLIMVAVFLIDGCFVEITATLLIFVPIIYPIACQYGVGFELMLIILCTMAIGQITPPVGVLLYLTMQMQGITLKETAKYLPAVLFAMLCVVMILVFFSGILNILPNLFMPVG